MYSTIEELPTEVRNSFDADDAKVWMEKYNGYAETMEPSEARKKAWHDCIELPSSFSFHIYASVEAVDSDGEKIDMDSILKNVDSYIAEGGNVQQAHSNYQIATIWDYEPCTEPETGKPAVAVWGNVYGGDGTNAEFTKAREDFLDGQNSLSIGGDASVEGYECDDEQCYVRRNLTELMEISLCHVPANPYAKLIWYNDKAVVKSKDPDIVTLKVDSVKVHRSYDECSFEKVAKALTLATKVPFTYRITKRGCMVSTPQETDMMGVFDSLKLHYDYDLTKSEFVVRSLEDELHRVFKRGNREGWMTKDGKVLTEKVTAGELAKLYRKGCVCDDGDGWSLNMDVLKDDGATVAGTEGASNPLYSKRRDDDKAIITYEEMMDWKSRVTKTNCALMINGIMDGGGYYGHIKNARAKAKELLTNDMADEVWIWKYNTRTGEFEYPIETWEWVHDYENGGRKIEQSPYGREAWEMDD